jgi:hypothetical protein
MAKGNTNDMKREEAAKPQAGYKIHEGKEPGNYACPNSGTVEHHEKEVGHEKGTLAQPNAGAHETGKDPKNVATPKSGVHDERKDQKRFDENHDELKRKRL